MNRQDALNREEMIKYVMSCWDEEGGGFGAHPRHDAHLLATMSAVQILAIQDALGEVDKDRIVSCESMRLLGHETKVTPSPKDLYFPTHSAFRPHSHPHPDQPSNRRNIR